MTNTIPSPLLELAERCEKATGPDYRIDNDIADAVGKSRPHGNIETYIEGQHDRWFTASLDAAMTLVDDDSGMSFAKAVNHSGGWSVALYDENIMARGATRALALCAAALRARAEGHKQ